VKPFIRMAIVVVATLACATALAAASSPAKASSVHRPKATQTVKNVRRLQFALQAYTVDHNDHWPRFTTSRRFRAMLAPYVSGRWPINPWSHRSMRQKHNRGNFTYRRIGDSYRLVAWGPHRRRIIVIP
jgi:hypothetical protein